MNDSKAMQISQPIAFEDNPEFMPDMIPFHFDETENNYYNWRKLNIKKARYVMASIPDLYRLAKNKSFIDDFNNVWDKGPIMTDTRIISSTNAIYFKHNYRSMDDFFPTYSFRDYFNCTAIDWELIDRDFLSWMFMTQDKKNDIFKNLEELTRTDRHNIILTKDTEYNKKENIVTLEKRNEFFVITKREMKTVYPAILTKFHGEW